MRYTVFNTMYFYYISNREQGQFSNALPSHNRPFETRGSGLTGCFTALVANTKIFIIYIVYIHTMAVIFNSNCFIIFIDHYRHILGIGIPSIGYYFGKYGWDIAIESNA